MGRYMDMGFTREVAAMALVLAGAATDDGDLVIDNCAKYQRLHSMKFKSDLVVGALIRNEGDDNAAANELATLSARR